MASTKKDINIELVIQKTAKETVKELERSKLIKNDSRNYFQKTESLLYSYPDLIQALKQKDIDIKYIEEHGVGNRSKDIVLYSGSRSSNNGEGDEYIDILDGYRESRKRTARLVDKIERALSCIKDDPYYNLIEKKYFEKIENVEIEEIFSVSDRTIRRNKNRLVNQLKVVIFGADGLEELG